MMWDGGWVWMCGAMLVFWALVAWVILTLVRQGNTGARDGNDTQALLDKRFARGDLDEDEYRRRRDLIRH
jgi:putative membrane protein